MHVCVNPVLYGRQEKNKVYPSPAGLFQPNDLEQRLLLFSHPVPFMATKQQEVPAEMTHPVEANKKKKKRCWVHLEIKVSLESAVRC